MMKQAKELQENMKKMQENLADMEVVGESGGGMVKVTMRGDHSVRSLQIEDEVWADQDRDLIEDLIVAAMNQASQAVSNAVKEKQKEMMAGLPIPPGFSL
ncbi:MAG: YbaB/EbfC family nucleoid-associated protein [Zetaproteobacteria bacterium]|nr:YbaB/EbfC family nucleoid-associated protein [Zetaproteobacteria bacterium]